MKRSGLIAVIAMMYSSLSAQVISLPDIPEKEYSVLDYGAHAGAKDNTRAIQAAVDACAADGGGRIIIPEGTFLCGPIEIKPPRNSIWPKARYFRPCLLAKATESFPEPIPTRDRRIGIPI